MNYRKFLLPVAVSMLLSCLNLINNSVGKVGLDATRLVKAWAVSVLYLLVIWVVNGILYSRQYFIAGNNRAVSKIASAVLCNVLLVVTIAYSALFIARDTSIFLGQPTPGWVIFIKLSIASAIIISVQYTMDSLRQAQAYKLANVQLANENLEARLQALKQQINPHFLFNALSTLRTMVRDKDGNAEKFIISLSDVYRQLLNKKDDATITLQEELGFLSSYVFMLRARFEDTLLVNLHILPGSMQKRIPSLSLQLLVENCIKHNIVSLVKPLVIDIYQNDATSITVENTLQVKPSAGEESSGTGLQNLKKRYALLGIENGVYVPETEGTFIVVIKLLP